MVETAFDTGIGRYSFVGDVLEQVVVKNDFVAFSLLEKSEALVVGYFVGPGIEFVGLLEFAYFIDDDSIAFLKYVLGVGGAGSHRKNVAIESGLESTEQLFVEVDGLGV